LKGYSKKYMGDNAWYEVGLQPMSDIHLHSELRSEFEPNGNITAVYIFAAIACVILLLACFNFTMLATARSLRRAKEVGLRKTLGAQRRQLIFQFLGESFLYTIASGVLSLLLIRLLLPQFNSFTGKALLFSLGTNVYFIAFIVGVILVSTILAGIYPAFSLSSLTPVLTLRGGSINQSSFGNIRKALIVAQFSISIVLISATLIIHEQMDLVKQTFTFSNDEQVIVLPINTEIRKKFRTVKDVLAALPGVSNVSGASILPSKGSSTNCYKIQDVENELCAYTYLTDVDFLRTHNFKIIAGRDFNANLTSDSLAAFIVNRKALAEMGITNTEEALNKTIEIGPIKGDIIGIVEDFHTWSLRDSINSTVIATWKPGVYNYISIKATAGSITTLLPEIENVWNNFSHASPFDYFFLDESFALMHAKEMKTAKTLSLFSLIAILISCLGVIGVASYMAEQRTKEVGIRKTLGASVSTILVLFNKDFIKLIAIALLLAGPMVWFGMNRWLQGFAYRIQVSPWTIVLAGIAALVLMLLSVSYFTLKAARANPVQSLKSE
jgi:putative ABC transport system permease protein